MINTYNLTCDGDYHYSLLQCLEEWNITKNYYIARYESKLKLILYHVKLTDEQLVFLKLKFNVLQH